MENLFNDTYKFVGYSYYGNYVLFAKLNSQNELVFARWNCLTSDDVTETMESDFDWHDARVESVQDGDTDDWYSDWVDNMYVRDVANVEDFVTLDEDLCDEAKDNGFDYGEYDYECIDFDGWYSLTIDRVKNEVLRLWKDGDDIFNIRIVDFLKETYGMEKCGIGKSFRQ